MDLRIEYKQYQMKITVLQLWINFSEENGEKGDITQITFRKCHLT